MKNLNKNLHSAKKQKNDEFYTQLYDIEREMLHYKTHFEGKTIYCNCDDPYESNFFKFFALGFKHLKLKKLIATCYKDSPISNKKLSLFDDESPESKTTRGPHKIEITEIPDMNNDGAVDLTDVALLLASDRNHLTRLNGDGDFRSEECIEILQEADIVVTNPPFSLFREYVAQLMEYDKKFIIIGSQNAITYKEIFKLIKENRLWLGNCNFDNSRFIMPEYYDITQSKYAYEQDGIKYGRVSGLRWFTNLEYPKRHEDLLLWRKYNETDYPKYDNYDAIEVSKTSEIPCDYEGVMGVPITFLDKYNPEQFDVVGLANDKREIDDAFIQGEETYLDAQHKRFVGMVLKENGKLRATYARIIIKNKKPTKGF